eukprot:3162117-Pyramimonas_sp.AAC.1
MARRPPAGAMLTSRSHGCCPTAQAHSGERRAGIAEGLHLLGKAYAMDGRNASILNHLANHFLMLDDFEKTVSAPTTARTRTRGERRMVQTYERFVQPHAEPLSWIQGPGRVGNRLPREANSRSGEVNTCVFRGEAYLGSGAGVVFLAVHPPGERGVQPHGPGHNQGGELPRPGARVPRAGPLRGGEA